MPSQLIEGKIEVTTRCLPRTMLVTGCGSLGSRPGRPTQVELGSWESAWSVSTQVTPRRFGAACFSRERTFVLLKEGSH